MARGRIVILVVLTVALAGCGSSDESVPAADEGGFGVDGGDGGGAGDDGGQGGATEAPTNGDAPESLAADFAIAIAPGWVFDILGDIGLTNTTGAQLLYPEEAFEDVVAFYDDWTADQAVDYLRTDIGNDIVFQSTEVPVNLITVTDGYEERGQVFTYLIIAVGE